MTVRVGLLGAGGVGARHARTLAGFADVELVGICDPDAPARDALAGALGVPAVDDLDRLLRARPDAVWICVPPFAHGGPEEAVLAAGLPFFVEKPLAADLPTAERVARAVAGARVPTATGYHWRHLDTVDRARGALTGAPVRLVQARWWGSTPPPAWWSQQAASGGQVVEQATHLLDVARVLVGEVVTVRADGTSDDAGPGDIVHASTSTARFETGAVGSFSTTCLLPGGYRMAVELFAPGTALRLSERDLLVLDADGERLVTPQVDPVLEADRQLVRAVRGQDADLRTTYAEALRTHRLAWAVTEAARTGSTVGLTDAVRA
jgi:myo-inositol 2-dehydrogenase/D-chiro-inositol 1-dehydrogenase